MASSSLCVKPLVSESEDADSIDDDCLVCIDEYPHQKLLTNYKNERVPRKTVSFLGYLV